MGTFCVHQLLVFVHDEAGANQKVGTREVQCVLCLRATCIHDPSLKPHGIREVIYLDTFVYKYIIF